MSHRTILFSLLAAAFLSGCAYQGIVTEKRSRPLPFYESLGMDAIYNFQLRDNAGAIHSQMVTPEVFASYRVGDRFDDLQPPPASADKEMPEFRAPPPELIERPSQPVRVMQLEPRPVVKATAKVAARAHHRSKSAAKTAKVHHRRKHAAKIAQRKHRTKKRVNVSGKQRTHPRSKPGASSNV